MHCRGVQYTNRSGRNGMGTSTTGWTICQRTVTSRTSYIHVQFLREIFTGTIMHSILGVESKLDTNLRIYKMRSDRLRFKHNPRLDLMKMALGLYAISLPSYILYSILDSNAITAVLDTYLGKTDPSFLKAALICKFLKPRLEQKS